MQNNAVTSSRRLLPRWRTLARTPPSEIAPTRNRIKRAAPATKAILRNAIARWEQTKALSDASDIIDAALIAGDYSIAVPAALGVLQDGNGVPALNAAAEQILSRTSDRPAPQLSSEDERSGPKIQKAIASLKWRLRVAPRDALSALEIARLQSLIGQRKSAERYAEKAVKLAPNDRYVLRSVARFWAHRSVPGDGYAERALETIWASDVVRVDPWVQAAEVSVANICGRTPRWGTKAKKGNYSAEPNVIQNSELASGLATLELHAGAPAKNIRKLIRISLNAPTENALAQAMWARDEVKLDFNFTNLLETIPNANEARARAAYEVGNFEASADECWRWVEDENFSLRAALAGAFVCSSLLGQYERAIRFAEQGLRANPNDPMMTNSKLVALAYNGRTSEAESLLPQLEAFESNRLIRPYVHAGRGLVAFRLGNLERGRHFYDEAIQSCRELSNQSLAGNAMIYWLEQELFSGAIALDKAAAVVAKLDHLYSLKDMGLGKSPVWNVRRKLIIGMMEQAKQRQAILQPAVKTQSAGMALLTD